MTRFLHALGLVPAALAAVSVHEAVDRVENALLPRYRVEGQPPATLKLADQMKRYGTPGISVAVIRGGKIAWARGFGVQEAGSSKPVNRETVFQAASISKPVSALAALHMAQYGHFTLDEDVNGKLKTWKVPENQFTSEKKVTLRELLSHSAGLTVHGFRGYADGEPVPTLPQLLDGAKPANSAAIRVDVAPGSVFRYSGGGYSVMQQLLIDRMNRPFPEIMNMVVLRRLGMTRSTYEQPLPSAWHSDAARAHRPDGSMVKGRWHTYPEMAAAGLWTTPTDLARFAIEVWKAARGESNKVIERGMTEAMLTRQKGDYGLGLAITGEGAELTFGHGGSNQGYRCNLMMFRQSGDGIVVMTNGDLGDSLARMVARTLSVLYGWPGRHQEVRKRASVAPEVLKHYAGVYELGPGNRARITLEEGKLYAYPPQRPKAELVPESESSFFSFDEQVPPLEFVREGPGPARAVRLFGREARRVE